MSATKTQKRPDRCKFCGGIAQLIERRDEDHWMPRYAVSCIECGAVGPSDIDEKVALKKWNRCTPRLPSDIPDGTIEREYLPPRPWESPVTEKQRKFAAQIAKELKIKVPLILSKEVYREWIGRNYPLMQKLFKGEPFRIAEEDIDNIPLASALSYLGKVLDMRFITTLSMETNDETLSLIAKDRSDRYQVKLSFKNDIQRSVFSSEEELLSHLLAAKELFLGDRIASNPLAEMTKEELEMQWKMEAY